MSKKINLDIREGDIPTEIVILDNYKLVDMTTSLLVHEKTIGEENIFKIYQSENGNYYEVLELDGDVEVAKQITEDDLYLHYLKDGRADLVPSEWIESHLI